MAEERDLRGMVESERGGLERILDIIPGYRGYKEKEMRRQADRLLRDHLARGFEAERSRLGGVQTQLVDAGKLAAIVMLERANMRLQLLIDRVKVASYGYSGWFDAVRVREDELDALYSFDAKLAEELERLRGVLDVLAEASAKDEDVSDPANQLVALAGELNDTWSKRQDVIIGAV